MPITRWSAESKLHGIFGGSLFHEVISKIFPFFKFYILILCFYFYFIYIFLLSFYTTSPLYIYYGFNFHVFIRFLSTHMYGSLFPVLSSWSLFLLFVGSSSGILVYIYTVLILLLFIEIRLFSNERPKTDEFR